MPAHDKVKTLTRRRPLRANWGMLLWLTLVWVLLWGEFSLANLLSGIIVAIVVTTALPLPKTPLDHSFRPWPTVKLIVKFFYDIVVASMEIAWLAIRGRRPHGAVIRVQLRSHSDIYLTITAGMSALVPGSVVVEAHRLTGVLYVHIVDVELQGGLETARATVLAQEERILRAFATDEELLDAGLLPGGTSGGSPVASPGGAPDHPATTEEGSA